jgi:Ca2+-binding EF-hand superfamily protein
MNAKVISVLAIGAATAAVGGAVFVFGGRAPEAVAALPVQPAVPAPVVEPEPMALTTGSVFEEPRMPGGENRWGDLEERFANFDWSQFQQLSPEERREQMRAMRAELEARLDTNGDGVVDDDERLDGVLASPMGQRLLDRFDTNGDGALDAAERQAMREQEAQRRAEQQARTLERWDADGDGRLSQEERQAMENDQRRRRDEQFQRMTAEFDRDGDGQLNADEQSNARQVMRERGEIDAFVRRNDSNGDGQITTVDLNAFLQLYQSGNSRADVNGDGSVDALDVSAFRDMMARSANRP